MPPYDPNRTSVPVAEAQKARTMLDVLDLYVAEKIQP